MIEALRLAKQGLGKTSPNPMVGAVIVKNGKIIGKGYHKKAGGKHAEVIALNVAGKKSVGATLYVNLEPCCHWGRTPPCTQAIINAGIKEVHIAMIDPSPWVNGKGIDELREAGIKVIIGECEVEATELNEAYLKWVKTGIPFVMLKAAITLDGKIANSSPVGARLPRPYITNELSRKYVHRLRSQVDAVMVGVGTVIADNPELTVRLVRGKNPKRIILDSNLRIPAASKVLGDGCIIASLKDKAEEGIKGEVWQIKANNGRVDILEVLKRAGKQGIQSILIEGGKEVFTSALSKGIVDKVYFFIAPKLFGNGIPMIGNIVGAIQLRSVKFRRFGSDILIEGRVNAD